MRCYLAVGLLGFALAACSSTSDTAETGSAGTTGAAGGAGIGATGLGSYGSGSVQPGTQSDLEVNVGDKIYFAYDSSTLDEAARQTLDRQGKWLQQFQNVPVTIEGYTDERGTREYNLALGERRAAAAKSYLAALGVSPSRLTTISYGEERPADPGHDERAYALNRRAVTAVSLTQ